MIEWIGTAGCRLQTAGCTNSYLFLLILRSNNIISYYHRESNYFEHLISQRFFVKRYYGTQSQRQIKLLG